MVSEVDKNFEVVQNWLQTTVKHGKINGWIIYNIYNHEMVAKMIFLNKNYTKKKASKLSRVAFY